MSNKIEMPDPQKKLQLQKESAAESTAKVFKFFSSFLPYVGSHVGASLDLYLSRMSEQRIKECFERVEKYVKALPENILFSEQFIDTAKRTAFYVMNEASKRKRELFAQTLKNYCAKKYDKSYDNAEFDEIAYHQRILSELSEGELDTLYVVKKMTETCKPTDRDRNKILSTIMSIGIPHYTDYHDAFLEKLSSLGLIRKIELYPKPTKPSLPNYEITPTGAIFLHWISMANADEAGNQSPKDSSCE